MATFTVSSRANLYLPNTVIDLEMRLGTTLEANRGALRKNGGLYGFFVFRLLNLYELFDRI